jgi:hypothetical protein
VIDTDLSVREQPRAISPPDDVIWHVWTDAMTPARADRPVGF